MIVWISLEVDAQEYQKLAKHIQNNMFFGIKRIAKNLQHMIFHSIGDHMYEDIQDIENAEIFLQQKIEDDTLKPDVLKNILEDDKWYIRTKCPNKNKKEGNTLFFIVEKESDLILFREEKTINEKEG